MNRLDKVQVEQEKDGELVHALESMIVQMNENIKYVIDPTYVFKYNALWKYVEKTTEKDAKTMSPFKLDGTRITHYHIYFHKFVDPLPGTKAWCQEQIQTNLTGAIAKKYQDKDDNSEPYSHRRSDSPPFTPPASTRSSSPVHESKEEREARQPSDFHAPLERITSTGLLSSLSSAYTSMFSSSSSSPPPPMNNSSANPFEVGLLEEGSKELPIPVDGLWKSRKPVSLSLGTIKSAFPKEHHPAVESLFQIGYGNEGSSKPSAHYNRMRARMSLLRAAEKHQHPELHRMALMAHT